MERSGGEKFVILLPQTSTELAILIGKRIQDSLHHELEGRTVSIEMAMATYPIHASTPDELSAQADALMYQAKKSEMACFRALF